MGGRPHKLQYPNLQPKPQKKIPLPSLTTSILDKMIDGREYQSLIGIRDVSIDLGSEMKKALAEIASIRKKPNICFLANTINPIIGKAGCSISIDGSDDMPFIEMLKSIPSEIKDIDIILVTPGGFADSVDYFVKKLRDRFDNIGFILPYMAMSAGTIFCLSGDELIMSESAFIGPIDPQVPSRNGMLVPAQSLMTLIADIKTRGEEQLKAGKQPDWTDVVVLKNLDPKELGNAITASRLSTRLVTEYLKKYKFKNWTEHSNGMVVTEEERNSRAGEIANKLCDNSHWLSHGSRISREIAVEECKLKVTYPETISGLDRAIKRFWALMRWTFENNPIAKVYAYAPGNYFIFRGVNMIQDKVPGGAK